MLRRTHEGTDTRVHRRGAGKACAGDFDGGNPGPGIGGHGRPSYDGGAQHPLETDQGVSLRYLNPDQPPEAVFPLLPGEKVRAAYAYCNLHGLWMAS